MTVSRVYAAIALVVALASQTDAADVESSSSSVATKCYDACKGNAYTFEDPHVYAFDGYSTHLADSPALVNLYSLTQGGETFSIDAYQVHQVSQGTGFQVFEWISFGDQNITVDSLCSEPGDSTYLTHAWGSGLTADYMEGYIWCQHAPSYPSLGMFLQISVSKVDQNTAGGTSFMEIEQAKGATGKFMETGSSRRLRGDDKRSLVAVSDFVPEAPAWSEPGCYSVCFNTKPSTCGGDPHCTTLEGKSYTLSSSKPTEYTVYSIPGNTTYDEEHNEPFFVSSVQTNTSGLMYVFTFNETASYDSIELCTSKGTWGTVSTTFPDGSRVRVDLRCDGGDKNPMYWDFDFYKYNRVYNDDDDFMQIESDEGSFGLVIAEPTDQ